MGMGEDDNFWIVLGLQLMQHFKGLIRGPIINQNYLVRR
jgi:hypothetical protein